MSDDIQTKATFDAELELLWADNARLRRLIELAQWCAADGHERDAACPWCAGWQCIGEHESACPAFTPEGVVR